MNCKLSSFLGFVAGLGAVALVPFWYFSFTLAGLLAAAVGAVFFVLAFDLVFRVAYFRKHNRAYAMVPKVPFSKICVEPHPYLPYALKRNARNLLTGLAPFPLNKDKGFKTDRFNTNSMGHSNGPDGAREVAIPKPEGLCRIHCLGASTTHNYIYHENNSYSYPLELEKILRRNFPEKKNRSQQLGSGRVHFGGGADSFSADRY